MTENQKLLLLDRVISGDSESNLPPENVVDFVTSVGNFSNVSNNIVTESHRWDQHLTSFNLLHSCAFQIKYGNKYRMKALPDVMIYLLNQGVDINAINSQGDTPLFYLIQRFLC